MNTQAIRAYTADILRARAAYNRDRNLIEGNCGACGFRVRAGKPYRCRVCKTPQSSLA